MERCRIKLAIKALEKSLKCGNDMRRNNVLIGVRQLISWLGGDTALPVPNAISKDDDSLKYCDECFASGTVILTSVDHMDLCGNCHNATPSNRDKEEEALCLERKLETELRVQYELKCIEERNKR